MARTSTYPVLMAVIGAVLFGASAPLSKVLLEQVDPVLLAGLLYLGSGLGLLIFKTVGHFSGLPGGKPLEHKDTPWLAGAVLAGGVAAPIVLMLGLRATPAATASLLLNFESVSTTLLAATFFHEYIGKRVWLAIVLVTAASIILTFSISGARNFRGRPRDNIRHAYSGELIITLPGTYRPRTLYPSAS